MDTPELLAQWEEDRNQFDQRLQAATLAVRYSVALNVVERIDAELETGRRHYRSRDGQLLTTLDQVVQAVLSDNLAGGEAQLREVA